MWWHTRKKPDFVFRRKGRVRLNRREASVQSTTGSRGVRISGSNDGYTMFRRSVRSIDYTLHSPVSFLLPLPCVTACHHISTGLYYKEQNWSQLFCYKHSNISSSRLSGMNQDCALLFLLHFLYTMHISKGKQRLYVPCVNSGFRVEVADNCDLLGHYAASGGNLLIQKSQQDAHVTEFILSDDCSTCFGYHCHQSSGAQNNCNYSIW